MRNGISGLFHYNPRDTTSIGAAAPHGRGGTRSFFFPRKSAYLLSRFLLSYYEMRSHAPGNDRAFTFPAATLFPLSNMTRVPLLCTPLALYLFPWYRRTVPGRISYRSLRTALRPLDTLCPLKGLRSFSECLGSQRFVLPQESSCPFFTFPSRTSIYFAS